MSKIVGTALLAGVAAALFFTPGGQGFFVALVNGVGATFGVGTTMAAFIAGAGVGATLGVVGEIAKPSGYDMGAQAGAKIPVTNTVAGRQIVYGNCRVAGSEVAIDEDDPNPSNDTPNQDFIFARVVADHPISGFGQFYLGDEPIDFTDQGGGVEHSNTHGDKLRIRKHTGGQTTADWVLENQVSGFTAAHVGRGLAYYVIKAVYEADLFPYGAAELRRCSIEVIGKKVYDMRKDSTYPGGSGTHRPGDPSTWEHSTNPALCILDYLRDVEGIDSQSVPDDEIDFESFRVAAAVCDEPVGLKGGGTANRYTMNGIIDLTRTKDENLKKMLTAMSGRQMWDGGKLHVFAADYDAPASTLNDDDILSATYSDMPARDQRTNNVYGTYIDPSAGYEPQEFPAYYDAAAQAIEGKIDLNLNLPFCRDHREAQRHAKIALRQSRQPALQLTVGGVGLAYGPMSTVYVTSDVLGLTNEIFRVVDRDVKVGKALTCTLSLVGEDPGIYEWNEVVEERDKNTLPAVFSGNPRAALAPTGMTATQQTITNNDGTETAGLLIGWDTPHPTVVSTLVDFRKNGTTKWIAGGSVMRGEAELLLLLPENSNVDIRARHALANGVIGAEAILLNQLTPDVAGSGTLTWGDITGDGKPEDYADVTADAMMELGARWAFNGSDDGWTTENVSLSVADDYISCTTTAANNSITSPADLNIDGSKYTRVIFKMRRTAASGGVDYDTPVLFYATTGHGISTSYRKAVTRPFKLGEWVIFTFDMTKLTAGGTDWTTRTITQLKLDLSFQSGDGFDIDYIALGKPGMPSSGVETPNLIDDKYYTSYPASDTDSPSEYAYVTLEDLGLKVGDVISASIEVQTQGARRGRVGLFFAQSNWTQIKTPGGGLVSTGASEWKVAKLEGYQIPPLTHYVRIIGGRENGVSGAVAFRRPVINRGAVASRPAGTRPDVEEGATNTTNTNQLTDGAGLGQTATWSNVTGTGKPENDATRNTGVLADRSTVAEAHIDDYATTRVGGGEGPGEVSFAVDSGSGLNRTIISASNLTGNNTGREVMVSARAQLKCGSASTDFYIRIVRNGNTATPLIDEVITVYTSYRGFSLLVVDESPGTNPDYSFVIRYAGTNRTVTRKNAHITAVSFNR